MGKAEKIEQRWRQGALKDVPERDVLLVLEANGFSLRRDRNHHWLAKHALLVGHPEFGAGNKQGGRVKINCHHRGKARTVHPLAVKDVLKALDFIRSKEKEQEDET